MYSLVQNIFVLLIGSILNFGKRQFKIRRVARMSPEKLQQWREQEIARLHARAVGRSSRMRDKDLVKLGLTRADSVRRLEVVMRGDRGREMCQSLMDGMDVRGLDLSVIRRGSIRQEHIDRAVGDRYTKLPPDLKAPAAWV